MERVEVIEAYINSMHVDDSDGDDNTYRDDKFLITLNGVDCNVIMMQRI